MPVPNDLSPEEEAEFSQHGVAPAGPGREPLSEEGAQPPVQEPPLDQPRDESGRFAPKQGGEAAPAEGGAGQGGGAPPAEGGEQTPPPPGFVPHAALHAERVRFAEMSRRAQLAETRMNALLMNQRGGGEQTPEMPTLTDDPVAYIQALEQRLSQFETGRQEEQQTRQLDSALEDDEILFQQTVPDYSAASDHYVRSRAQELLQFYPPQQAQQIMATEARQIAREAWQRGQSAAQTIYTLAMARGYNPNAPQRQPAPGEEQQPQGGGKPSATEIVEGIKRGQQQSRSLSGGGGAGRTEALNAEALLNMSDEEFEEHLALGTKGANARFAAIG